MTGDISGAA